MATTKIATTSVNTTVIEEALERLKTESRFTLPDDKKHSTDFNESRIDNSNIRESFVNLIVDSMPASEVQELYVLTEAQNKTVKVFGVKYLAAMDIINLAPSVAIELFTPTRGSFDWDKKDWESRDAEVEAFFKHVESVIFKATNYRLGYGKAETSS